LLLKKWVAIAMKVSEIKEALSADLLTGEEFLDREIVGGGGADLMEDVLSAVAKGAVLLTGLTSDHVIRTAKISGVGAIVFVRGKRPEANVIDLAQSLEIPLLLTKQSLFVAAGRLYMNGLRGLDGSW
jgi:predicted transcriptional regulator